MRHPTNGLNEDDLSRLTGSSSSSSSSSSTASTPSHDLVGISTSSSHQLQLQQQQQQCTRIPIVDTNCEPSSVTNLKTSESFNSTYLPEIIDPLEWQKSRKRKERLDSTSSTTQDRKLIRSNSEELLPNPDNSHHDEVIRRVASHEDFQKKPLQEINRDDNALRTIQENDNNYAKSLQQHQKPNNNVSKPARLDTSPARSHRVSPNRDYRSGKYKENDDSECEHEKRRSSERFCKSRAPGRKSGNYKKSKYMSKCRERDENVYKYDISAMKYERRGFVSKFKMEERGRKEEAADGEQIHDHNDNNLIDFHMKNDYMDLGICPAPYSDLLQQTVQSQFALPPQSSGQLPSSLPPTTTTSSRIETVAEALPWDSSVQEDQTPVLCRRFAPFEEYGTDGRSKHVGGIGGALTLTEASKCAVSFRSFTKSENFKTRTIMQNMATIGHFNSPEERLRWINKRLTALKKRVSQLEENFECNYGYRPSQVDKFNDKQIKTVMAEISRLRKEKHDLKSDPVMAMGLKVSGGMDSEKKLAKMTETLKEIEVKLTEKRKDGNWSENLDGLTAEQLVLEKTALQHSLLYFESLYGRPATRDERDVVRSLYDRYRTIKRLVSRSLSIAGTVSGIPELPTILEHEAFTVEPIQQPSFESTDTPSSPDHPSSQLASVTTTPSTPTGGSDSFSDSGSNQSLAGGSSSDLQTSSSNPQSEVVETIHTMSVDELWDQLEKVRYEKKELKRVIKEFEAMFEVQSGRKMLKTDRRTIEDTYFQYKQKKAKVRLLQALIKKNISK